MGLSDRAVRLLSHPWFVFSKRVDRVLNTHTSFFFFFYPIKNSGMLSDRMKNRDGSVPGIASAPIPPKGKDLASRLFSSVSILFFLPASLR